MVQALPKTDEAPSKLYNYILTIQQCLSGSKITKVVMTCLAVTQKKTSITNASNQI